MRSLLRRLAFVLRRRDDFSAELDAHLSLMIDERMRRGMSQEEARRDAVLKLGGITQLKESHREWSGLPRLEIALRDVRLTARSLLREPLYTTCVITVLALGIGVATAGFNVVRGMLFRTLPYSDADRLISVGLTLPHVPHEVLFGSQYVRLRELVQSTEDTPVDSITSITGVADCQMMHRRIGCAQVESTMLGVLGVQPQLGADLTESDDHPSSSAVVLLSHSFWISAFGSDGNVVGRVVDLDGNPAMVRGVLPAGFELPTLERFEVFVPQRVDYEAQARAQPGRPLRVFARLRPGSSLSAVRAAAATLSHSAGSGAPPGLAGQVGIRVRSVRDMQNANSQLAARLLFGSTACLFLIACGNAVFLILARASKRAPQTAIRHALGASRARLAFQSLAESLLLSVPAGVVGCAIMAALIRIASATAPAGLLGSESTNFDLHTVAFALLLAAGGAVAAGLAPTFPRAARSKQPLAIAQIAATVVLLSTSAVMLRSLSTLQARDPGMVTEHIATANFILPRGRFATVEQQIAALEQLENHLAAIPGAIATAVSDSLPPVGTARSQPLAALTSNPPPGVTTWRFVTPGYFRALGIPVVSGRGFTEEDRTGELVTVVNENLARTLFMGRDAVGQEIRVSDAPARIVGVVASPSWHGPEYFVVRGRRATGAVYANQAPPHGWRRASVAVRTAIAPEIIASALRREIEAVDPDAAITTESMDDRFRALTERPRFGSVVLSCFAAAGLFLAALGLYGLTTFLAAERRKELAVRLALGADKQAVEWLVISRAVRWVVIGGLCGTALAIACGRLLRTWSHGIGDVDATAILCALGVMTSICLLSAWLPARRAARLDPLRVLRVD